MNCFERVKGLIGENAFYKLQSSKVAVFGAGGVGGACIEALARSGIGSIAIIDDDSVCESNINRQFIANYSSIGQKKVREWEKRLKEINPTINVDCAELFYLPEKSSLIDFKSFDYVVDAVDTVTAKIDIIERCVKNGVPVISSMGTAGKLNPARLSITEIENTTDCPLAKVMRRELKKRGIKGVKTVFSDEKPRGEKVFSANGKSVPSSMIFVPAAAGIMIASEIVKELISDYEISDL